ncbi:MAG: hypothetical protein QOE61_4632, partial [Micromonosporaceae bacterium]|nr:hypothetical protein [Micromonosporaceae bacterium]
DSFTLRHWDFFEGEWLEEGPAAVVEMVAKDLGLAADLVRSTPAIMADAANRSLRRHLTGDQPSDR